jgi:ATP-binding cassette subfamily F protein 2
MSSKWHEKKAKLAEIAFERALQNSTESAVDASILLKESALGGGDEQVFEKKLTKEEKKAQAKAKREAKRKAKGKGGDNDDEEEEDVTAKMKALDTGDDDGKGKPARSHDDGIDHDASDKLAAEGTVVTYSSSRKGVDARARDINVTNVTLQHMGAILLDETQVVLNHGNRYGLVGLNGCGKSTFMKALGARALPIPNSIDIFFLKEEIEPSDTVTALEAVMSVDDERLKLEARAEELNVLMSAVLDDPDKFVNGGDDSGPPKSVEEIQEDIMEALNSVYERLDDLDADTAEVRARSILSGLGFSHEMQSKVTKDFSGGWRMRGEFMYLLLSLCYKFKMKMNARYTRTNTDPCPSSLVISSISYLQFVYQNTVSLARALFIQPVCLLLDEPTNHLDMEAVLWLEDYLSKWKRILLLVSHSQDFLNNVCSHMVHFNNDKRLEYYNGNYDTFVKTKEDLEVNQMKQYKWEQEQIKSMKEYVSCFVSFRIISYIRQYSCCIVVLVLYLLLVAESEVTCDEKKQATNPFFFPVRLTNEP